MAGEPHSNVGPVRVPARDLADAMALVAGADSRT
jgi:hypothetical protein